MPGVKYLFWRRGTALSAWPGVWLGELTAELIRAASSSICLFCMLLSKSGTFWVSYCLEMADFHEPMRLTGSYCMKNFSAQ